MSSTPKTEVSSSDRRAYPEGILAISRMSFTALFLLLTVVLLPFAFPGGAVFDADPMVSHSSLKEFVGGNAQGGTWAFGFACYFGEAWLLRTFAFLAMMTVYVVVTSRWPRALISEIVFHATLWLGLLALMVSALGILALLS